MEIIESDIDQGKLVAIHGRMDAMHSVDAQKKMLSILNAGSKNLVVDFKDVTFLSSAGLCALLIVAKKAKELGAFVCLVETSQQVQETLETTGFNSVIRTYKDLEAALNIQNH